MWLAGSVKTLGQPNAAWAGDRGQADGQVRAALAAADGSGVPDDYLIAVAALCGARLLMPVTAEGDESDGANPDRHAELAAVLLTSAAGASGALAFTGLDSLQAFDPRARPVPCTLDDAAATAQQVGASAIVVDVAGPHPLVIEAGLIEQLAAGRRLVRVEDGWGWLSVSPAR